MPLATREPRNGGVKIGTSVATSELVASGSASPAVLGGLGGLALRLARRQVAAAEGAPEVGVEVPVRLPSISSSIVRRPSNASLP